MGQVLYRKYRSKTLDEIVGQEHITTTLKNALASGNVSHAYLFTGPRGVGKTSIARILAHELNQLEYTGEDAHLDIIEIDAASNRGIDEIRDLREKVHMAPTNGKYKVYIIDEVHMLTTQAFNALLKTLEEPPAHVVFILATTESHKLPETIISRTQRYTFRPVESAKVVAHLQYIADTEGFAATKEALQLIAEHGEGSFRDSISLLNQAASHTQEITDTVIHEILGLPPVPVIAGLLDAVINGDKPTILLNLTKLHDQGYQAAMIAKQLGECGRELIITDTVDVDAQADLLALLTALLAVPASNAPNRYLELTLLSFAVPKTQHKSPAAPTKSVSGSATEPKPASVSAPKQTISEAPVAAADKTISTKLKRKPSANLAELDMNVLWPQVLDAIKAKHNTIYGILRMAYPEVQDEALVLTFKYAFHQKRMHEAKHRKIIADTLQDLTGKALTITCTYDKDMTDRTPLGLSTPEETVVPLVADSDKNDTLQSVSNIFGGGELLES